MPVWKFVDTKSVSKVIDLAYTKEKDTNYVFDSNKWILYISKMILS